MAEDKTKCPAHKVGHYYITIGRITFCMDCGKLAPRSKKP